MKVTQKDAKLKELMAKGYSKTKCTQALKDAGNNAQLALRLLERQQQTADPARGVAHKSGSEDNAPSPSPPPTAVAGASTAPSTAAKQIPSMHRKPAPSAAWMANAPEAHKKIQRQRERRHPCVVQYGSCQYGDFCLLKDFPGDVCVQHFQGCCLYGSGCRHRHVVDGVDVREVLRDAQAAEEAALLRLKDGAAYRIEEGSDTKVQRATYVGRVDDGAEDGSGGGWQAGTGTSQAEAARRLPPPQPSDFNQIRGSVPSHTEPLWPDAEGAEDGGSATHPTPFLDLARAAAATAAGESSRAQFAPHPAVTRAPAADAAPGQPPARSVGRHPCVAQYGSCKYGAACLHADRDADVCVHFLHGRCRYSAGECAYRHETAEEYQRALRERVGLTVPAPEPTAAPPATRTKNRLQGMGTAAAGAGVAGAAGGRVANGSPQPPAALRSPPHSQSHSALPSVDDLNALLSRVSSAADVSDTHGAEGMPISDAETRTFLGLLEAFPAVEPAVVLQVLRRHSGDPLPASEDLSQLDAFSSEEAESVAAALALAAADEAAEHAAAATGERHSALLTLLMLFPSMEVAEVEAMLTRHKNDFAATYNTLLCAQEKMIRSVLWRESTAKLSPADQLRYEKLCAMFPALHPDIVRSAFCATESDWASATAALNQLTKELLSLEAVEVPAGPVVWSPRAPDGTKLTISAAQPRRDREGSPSRRGEGGAGAASSPRSPLPCQETSEEAYEAYRAAEREILSYGDWRQVRQQAYLINSQRIRVLGQASAAFHQNDGRTAKLLSREGHRLAVEYNRLNRMAMLALEQERLRSDATSTLDLHGFHTGEVHDVLVRRVEVCQRKGIGRLRVVVGEGIHSRRGFGSLYTVVMDELRGDAFLKSATKVKSIKSGYVDVAVVLQASRD